MNEPPRFTLSVTHEEDRFACAAEGIRIARAAGLSDKAQQELAIAIAELVSNAVRHGGGGNIEIRALVDVSATVPRNGVEVIVRDSGPGLDFTSVTDQASRKAEPTVLRLPGQGLGVGLGAVQRLMHSVVVRSTPQFTTEIIAIKWA